MARRTSPESVSHRPPPGSAFQPRLPVGGHPRPTSCWEGRTGSPRTVRPHTVAEDCSRVFGAFNIVQAGLPGTVTVNAGSTVARQGRRGAGVKQRAAAPPRTTTYDLCADGCSQMPSGLVTGHVHVVEESRSGRLLLTTPLGTPHSCRLSRCRRWAVSGRTESPAGALRVLPSIDAGGWSSPIGAELVGANVPLWPGTPLRKPPREVDTLAVVEKVRSGVGVRLEDTAQPISAMMNCASSSAPIASPISDSRISSLRKGCFDQRSSTHSGCSAITTVNTRSGNSPSIE